MHVQMIREELDLADRIVLVNLDTNVLGNASDAGVERLQFPVALFEFLAAEFQAALNLGNLAMARRQIANLPGGQVLG